MNRLKVGLVLGGGGARGLAHIGIIKVFEQHHIPIDVITGSSMGALVGAAYAQICNADELEHRFRTFLFSEKFKLFGGSRFRRENVYEPMDLLHQVSHEFKRRIIINLAAQRLSLLKSERLDVAIAGLVHKNRIEDLSIPFACVAVDLVSGDVVEFASGDLYDALRASASIPGIFPPFNLNGRLLVDGAVSENFPIETAKNLGADIIIISNVSAELNANSQVDNVVDIIIRSNLAATKRLNELARKRADLVLDPEVGNYHWSDFEQINDLIFAGRVAAEKKISKLEELIKKRSKLVARFKLKTLEKFNWQLSSD